MADSVEVTIANALIDRLTEIESLPVAIDTNDGNRWILLEDSTPLSPEVIEVGPVESSFGTEKSYRSAQESAERQSWVWRALIMFADKVDLTSYENELSQIFLLTPEAGETFPPSRVRLISSVHTSLAQAPHNSSLELRFEVQQRRL